MRHISRRLEILNEHLADGWSVSYSLSKAGIDQREHTILLKNENYKTMIESFKQINKSPTDLYNQRIRSRKDSLI